MQFHIASYTCSSIVDVPLHYLEGIRATLELLCKDTNSGVTLHISSKLVLGLIQGKFNPHFNWQIVLSDIKSLLLAFPRDLRLARKENRITVKKLCCMLDDWYVSNFLL